MARRHGRPPRVGSGKSGRRLALGTGPPDTAGRPADQRASGDDTKKTGALPKKAARPLTIYRLEMARTMRAFKVKFKGAEETEGTEEEEEEEGEQKKSPLIASYHTP